MKSSELRLKVYSGRTNEEMALVGVGSNLFHEFFLKKKTIHCHVSEIFLSLFLSSPYFLRLSFLFSNSLFISLSFFGFSLSRYSLAFFLILLISIFCSLSFLLFLFPFTTLYFISSVQSLLNGGFGQYSFDSMPESLH